MICDICKSRNASVHIRKMSAGTPADYYLCTECAVKLGYGKRVNQFYAPETSAPLSDGTIRCKCCGCSLNDLVALGGPGCSECYQTFRDKIAEAIRKLNGELSYHGYVPAHASPRAQKEAQISQARAQMTEAIEQENFEQAAILRDYIRNLENGSGQ